MKTLLSGLQSTTENHPKPTMSTRPVVPPAGAILRRAITMAFLWALAVGAGGRLARAADSNPPERLTYQGFLANPDGTPFAPTTPINYDIVFRIYDAQTGGTPVWAEKQTVTVDKGQFAVLLGEGAANGSELRPSLSTVFAGATASDRYMELTVTINNAPLTIAPRLRLLTSAYAFLARNATALVSPNGSSVASAANGALTVNGSLNAGALTATSLAGNGAGLTGLTVGQIPALDASKIGSGTFTPAQIPSLDAGKITSGTLSATQIPALDAGKIAAGILPIARGGTGSGTQNFVDLVSNQINPSIKGNKTFFNYVMVNGWDGQSPRAPLDVNGDAVISGNLGIGTLTPTQAKLVVDGSVTHAFFTFGYGRDTWDNIGDKFLNPNLSILATHGIAADIFLAGSDARIKDVVGVSDPAADLSVLRQIAVTDYRYRDWRAKGQGVMKKVIAQQLEQVYPRAVFKSTQVVPDIYQMATITNGWVKLATNLKQGERVRLISEGQEGVHEVLEVKADGFRTAFRPGGDKVFVYGREVKDFRGVDYEAISMLNVSATQELARQVQALRKSEARVAELEHKVSRMEALERRAARVEALELKATKVETLERDLAELKKLVTRLAGPRLDERPAAEALPTTSTAAPKQ